MAGLVAAQQRAVMGRTGARALLSTIARPTVVIHSADDRLIPIEMGQECAAAMTGAESVVIEDAGHFLFQEQPKATTSAVAAFLGALNSDH